MGKKVFMIHAGDYAVFGVTTAVSMAIGIYHAIAGTGQKSTAKYLVGDRSMGVLPVSLSLVVTYMSSIFLLGNPAESYVYGIPAMLTFICIVISNGLAAWITVPLIHPLNITSSYEYLLLRYNSRLVQKIGSLLGMVKNSVYMGIVLYGPAIALDAVAGFPIWASITIVGLSSVVYTSIGGFKAVIWTDVFQMTIMVFGLLAILIKCLVDIESIRNFWDYNVAGKRIRMFELSPDPTIRTSFWSTLFGGTFYWFAITFNQQAVQRIVSMPTQAAAKKVLMLSVPGFYILAVLAALQGFAAYAYYTNKRCDPFEEGVISNSNEILPYFVMELFNDLPGFPGIFLAALFSASLSTLSSGLNSLSAITLNDFIKPFWPKLTDARATLIAKFLVLVFGIISVGVSFLIMNIGGPITQITGSLLGSLSGPNCGLFILGAFFPWTNVPGVITGVVVGLVVTFWIAMGGTTIHVPWLPPAPSDMCNVTSNLLNMTSSVWTNQTYPEDFIIYTDVPYNGTGLAKFYSISYTLYTVIGLLLTMAVGLLVSFLTGPSKPTDIDPKYISHVVRRFYYGKDLKVSNNRENDIEIPTPEKNDPVKTVYTLNDQFTDGSIPDDDNLKTNNGHFMSTTTKLD